MADVNGIQLKGDAACYEYIPGEVILEGKLGKERIGVYSYLFFRRGLDGVVRFSIDDIIDWMGKKRNRNPAGINSRVYQSLKAFEELGYVTLREVPQNSKVTELLFNLDHVKELTDTERFALVWLDELKSVMGSGDCSIGSEAALLVFSWLRMKIPRRSMEQPSDCAGQTEEEWVKGMPEAWNCFLKDIAADTGLGDKTVKAAVEAIESIGLIKRYVMPRRLMPNGQWLTSFTIFCNAEKRIGSTLMERGRPYVEREIANKIELLGQYYRD